MKLVSVQLRNFRQHVDSQIDFADGVTGLIGPNGAGKSTILEAVAWALYGAPAVRGTNDTIRSTASDGGSKASVALDFELGGSVYKVARSLDGSGRSGQASLHVDGRPLRTGMTEVSDAVTRLLGMDYRAFFTSFFTGQKQLEFMAQLDGRARGAMIGRMLGYDRLTRARDQANKDRIDADNQLKGLEQGLADPEELKGRKQQADATLQRASKACEDAESAHKVAAELVDKIKPAKEASDQKAKRHDETAHRLEIDEADAARTQKRLADVDAELETLARSEQEFDALKAKLAGFKDQAEEYKRLSDLQKHEAERQGLNGQMAAADREIGKLQARARELPQARERQTRLALALGEAEEQLKKADEGVQSAREQRVAQEQGLAAQIGQIRAHKTEIEAKRSSIEAAGDEGACPTCERPLAGELPKVLASFDQQIADLSARITHLEEQRKLTSDTSVADSPAARILNLSNEREKLATSVDGLRSDKSKADALVQELGGLEKDIADCAAHLEKLRADLAKLPAGYDQARFEELQKVKDSLQADRERAAVLKSDLDRVPKLQDEQRELSDHLKSKTEAIDVARKSLSELAFSAEDHQKLVAEFESASTRLNGLAVDLEAKRGDVRAASAVLDGIRKEEQEYQSRVRQLESKRVERFHLQVLAEALDKLRIDLNDRIRPELEAIAGELLATMTDGRYNTIEIDESYKATIRDDGELKPVISGGEEDVVNLALRLAISQMIAERAGQSFSLLVLDEVFGSLDETRRDNVVALLQNLKNRFEQIILITHVESIHDAVDNCLWVEFDEKTKTSRLTDRSNIPV